MPESVPGKALVVARFIIGGGTWVAPRTSGRLFGLDIDANPQAVYVGRLFAVRDAVLGVGLITSDGDSRRNWWRLGVACDIADTLAGLIAWRRGELSDGAAALVTVAAVMAGSLGAAALAADDA